MANAITALRILALPLLAWTIIAGVGWWAVALFAFAGLTDILDGYVARRRGESSAAGAMLDLLADRLLTFTAVTALTVAGRLEALALLAAALLVLRDLVVATLNEALPGRLGIRVSMTERTKVAFQFAGLAAAMAPTGPDWAMLREFGAWALIASAAVAVLTLADYAGRAIRAFRMD